MQTDQINGRSVKEMTKKIIVIILLVAMMFLLCGCDGFSDHILTNKTKNTKAYIKVGEKTIVVDVDSYMDGANGSVILYGIDGKIYETHFMNVVLVKDTEGR